MTCVSPVTVLNHAPTYSTISDRFHMFGSLQLWHFISISSSFAPSHRSPLIKVTQQGGQRSSVLTVHLLLSLFCIVSLQLSQIQKRTNEKQWHRIWHLKFFQSGSNYILLRIICICLGGTRTRKKWKKKFLEFQLNLWKKFLWICKHLTEFNILHDAGKDEIFQSTIRR